LYRSTKHPIFLLTLKSFQPSLVANTSCPTTPSLRVTQHSTVPPHHNDTHSVMMSCSSIPSHADHLTSIVHRSSDHTPLFGHPPNRGSSNRLAHSATDRAPQRICSPQKHSTPHVLCCSRGTRQKKNWFIDYVLQRIVSSVSVCRRRERLTHVECRMYFLARCHARALHTYAALFCYGPAGCVCIDWVACRLGCICKGRVCGKDLEGGTSSGREAENMGCVVRRVDM
jgi:hypothetical protein